MVTAWIMPQSITDERGEERGFDLRFARALERSKIYCNIKIPNLASGLIGIGACANVGWYLRCIPIQGHHIRVPGISQGGTDPISFLAPNIWNPSGLCKQPWVSARRSQGLALHSWESQGVTARAAKRLWKIQSWQELLDVSVCPLLLCWKHPIMESHWTFLSLLPSQIHPSIRSRPAPIPQSF